MDKTKIEQEINNGTFDTFRQLLKKGIGLRTQTQFAGETNISRGNINRLLNQAVIQKPSKKTIISLASHMSSVKLNDMLEACGYESTNTDEVVKAVSFNVDKLFRENIGHIYEKPVHDVIFDSLDYLYVEDYDVSIITDGRLSDQMLLSGTDFVTIRLHWKYEDKSGNTFISYGYTETKTGAWVLCDFTMGLECISQYGLFGDYLTKIRKIVFESKNERVYDAQSSVVGFDEVMDPNFDEKMIFGTILDRDKGSFVERYQETIFGCGFYYRSTPAGFREFLIANAEYFCVNKTNQELYKKIVDTNEDPDVVFKDFHGKEEWCEFGTGCAVAYILSSQTGHEFLYFMKDKHRSDDEPDDSCIMCPMDQNYSDDSLFDKKDLKAVYDAAVLLGIKNFGMVYYIEYKVKSKKQEYNVDTFHYDFQEDNVIKDKATVRKLYDNAKKLDRFYDSEAENGDLSNLSKRIEVGRIEAIAYHALNGLNDISPTNEMMDIVQQYLDELE